MEYFHNLDYFHIFGHNTNNDMFPNEISDKLQFFARQGMSRETAVGETKKKRKSGPSMNNRDRQHLKSHQLKLF